MKKVLMMAVGLVSLLQASEGGDSEKEILGSDKKIGTSIPPHNPSEIDLSQAMPLERFYLDQESKVGTLTLPDAPFLKKGDLATGKTINSAAAEAAAGDADRVE